MGKGNNGLLGKKRPFIEHWKGVPRKEARLRGDVTYTTGKPCLNGHIANRWTSDGACTACAAAKRKRCYDKDNTSALARTRKWREDNPLWLKEYRLKYSARRPEVKRASEAKRRVRLIEAGGTFTPEQIIDLYSKQNGRCAACLRSLRKTGYHIDHMTALIAGGSNDISNLQLLCPTDNVRKGRLDAIQYAQKLGRLL